MFAWVATPNQRLPVAETSDELLVVLVAAYGNPVLKPAVPISNQRDGYCSLLDLARMGERIGEEEQRPFREFLNPRCCLSVVRLIQHVGAKPA
jgi:hypothetical protein